MKTKINNHASIVLVYNRDEILSNIYDGTYPREVWRGKINLLGGGQAKGDKSPRQLLERELNEEFKIEELKERRDYDENFSKLVGEGSGAPIVPKFASASDINFVKKEIFDNLRAYKDYLANFPAYKDKPAFNVIFSVYISEVSHDVISCVKRNIAESKSLVSEGLLKITSFEDITAGLVSSAWIAGQVIEDIFKISVPGKDNNIKVSNL